MSPIRGQGEIAGNEDRFSVLIYIMLFIIIQDGIGDGRRIHGMIKSFFDKGTEDIFDRISSIGEPVGVTKTGPAWATWPSNQ